MVHEMLHWILYVRAGLGLFKLKVYAGMFTFGASSQLEVQQSTSLPFSRHQQDKMLPPIDSAVLQNNPDFATLYKTLTIAVLNPNGSTKNDPAAKKREAVREVHHLPPFPKTLD
jgi:hypothetical protein